MKMKRTMRRLMCAGVAIVVQALTGMAVADSPVRLTTNYMDRPMGIDTQPTFGWQMESTNGYGQQQAAYQLVMATSEKDLSEGRYVYDSGKVNDGRSVQMSADVRLKPCTRYYWTVRTWNSHQQVTEFAEPTWFETGLMQTGWGGAQWIGSDQYLISKYRTNFTVSFVVSIAKGSQKATFVFGAQSDADYLAVELSEDKQQRAWLRLYQVSSGEEHTVCREDVTTLLNKRSVHQQQNIALKVFAAQHARAYNIDMEMNGQAVLDSRKTDKGRELSPMERLLNTRKSEFSVSHANSLSGNSRLYQIGLKQEHGQRATFRDITIRSDAWNKTIYHDTRTHTVQNELKLWYPGKDIGAPMLRKEFRLSKPIKQARLYATARGIYDCQLNGKPVTESRYNAGWPDYRYRMYYNTFDVTTLLHQGQNAIGLMLGNGWWSDFVGYQTYWEDQYGLQQSAMCQLQVTYEDGSSETIVSDESWKCTNKGPWVENSFQNGEEYDARREMTGWSKAEFDDSDWRAVAIYDAPKVPIEAYPGGLIEPKQVLTAQRMTEPQRGIYVYDLGVNMVGVERLRLKGKAGQRITIRFGEMTWPDVIPTKPVSPYTTEMYEQNRGLVYTDNYRSALSTDVYICQGDGIEIYEPRLTQHGFRYIQIEGLDQPLPLESVQGVVLHSMTGGQTSHFECSEPLVNQLYQNILWGQRGNFLAVPTDCPQRDERLGYTGDGQVFSLAATYNYNVAPFYRRWLQAVRDNQDERGNFSCFSPSVRTPGSGGDGDGYIGWAEAGIIIPWHTYLQYGDLQLLRESYPSMLRYMDFLEQQSQNHLAAPGGLGDWLGPETTNAQLTNTAYYAYDALLMQKISAILGRQDKAEHYARLYELIKKAFCQAFVMEDGQTYTPAGYMKGSWMTRKTEQDEEENTQTSYVVPLKAGLFENKAKAVNLLRESIIRNGNKLTTGFIGTGYLNSVLSDNGLDSLAYQLLLQRECPSWLYPVLQGATTIWERWNSYTIENGFGPVDMNSFNHYSYGAVEEWLMQYVLGIRPDEQQPGYKHFTLDPHPNRQLGSASGHFDSVYGRIAVSWKYEGERICMTLTIPANTTATFMKRCSVEVTKGQQGIISQSNDSLTLSSGGYELKIDDSAKWLNDLGKTGGRLSQMDKSLSR